MSASHHIPVYVRNLVGDYLAGDGEQWQFTPDISKAHVFDYFRDKVAVQLEEAERDLGIIWVAAPVAHERALEKCDQCGIRMPPRAAYFDGNQFLCAGCRPSA